MKTIALLLAGLLCAIPCLAKDWETDFAKASGLAKAGDKYMLLDFTGSDWCHWCVKLEKDILSKKEFKEFATKNLVCVELDFPSQKKQSAELKKQNAGLQAKYGVRGYPTLILLSPAGDEVGRPGNRLNGPTPFINEINGLITEHRKSHPPAAKAK